MKLRRTILAILIIVPLVVASLFRATKASATITLVRDLLSTSRLSVAARVLTIVGNLVTIDPVASGNFNSTSSANLRGGGATNGDNILINGVAHQVNIVELASTNQFTTVNIAPAGSPTNPIYYKSQPNHQISFRTGSSVPNGFFRVLIPANASLPNDGLPDPDGFDFNSFTNAFSSSSATANFGFEPNLEGATASGGTNCASGYNCFEFHYSGTGPSASDITLWIGSTQSLLAPAPKSGHDLGFADTYSIVVQQFPNGVNPSTYTPIDTSKTKVGLIESVRVTATVDPSISFQIAGVPSGRSVCGGGGGNTTVSTQTSGYALPAVPFGTLGLNTFSTAAHNLVISTNATNGYIVTAIENDHMGIDGGTTPFIPDATCTGGACTATSPQAWNTVSSTYPGFGYSVGDAVSATPDFVAGGTFLAKPFANASLGQQPSRIMYSTGVSDTHSMNVCYRISVNATQAAGDYENQVTYTATATF